MKMLKDNKGAALVELALILWFLVLVAFGICEFGWALYVKNTMNRAAREGVRYAAVKSDLITDDPAVKNKVVENLTFAYDSADLTVVTTPPLNKTPGEPVKVEVNLILHTFTGLFPSLMEKPLHTEAAMRYEMQ